MFLVWTLYVSLITCVNIKQNIGYAWLLRPHVLDKLTFFSTCVNIKQNYA